MAALRPSRRFGSGGMGCLLAFGQQAVGLGGAPGDACRGLQRGQRPARISSGHAHQVVECRRVQDQLVVEAALICKGPGDERSDVVFLQRAQGEQQGP